MRRGWMLWAGVVFLLACLAGCGGGSGGGNVPPVNATIGGNGGQVVAGNARLIVPINSVSQNALFSIQPTTQYPADTRVVTGTAFTFTSSVSSFLQSLTISIHYNGALLKNGMTEGSLRLFQASGTTWTQLSTSTVDTNNKIVSGITSSLGTFAILATVGGGTGGTTHPTQIVYLSDLSGLPDLNGKPALSLYVTTLGSASALQIATYGQSAGQVSETITHAAFSPDGKTIVYDSIAGTGNLIILAQVDGSSLLTLLTATVQTSGVLAVPRAPSFSQDGTKVVFVYNQTGSDQIYTVNVDGTNLTQITKNFSGSGVDNPAYTKAGNIRFISRTSSGGIQYNLMNADGSNLTSTTTFSPAVAPWYIYSPDGTKIVYTAQSGGKSDVFLLNADGSNPTQLTKLAAAAIGNVRFTADSKQVLFDAATTSSTPHTLYEVNIDGTNLQALPVPSGTTANTYLADTH